MSLLNRIAYLVLFPALTAAPLIVAAQSQSPEPPADESVYQSDLAFKRSSLAAVAFGSYVDEQTKEQIIVLPADSDARALEAQLDRGGSSPQRLHPAMLTRAVQAQLEQALARRNYHPDADKYTMATYFDLKSGKQLLVTDAPRHVTEVIEKRYPNQIDIQFGSIVTNAARQADRPLFSGAAGIKAVDGGFCTSGWKVRRGSVAGVLAPGHCWGPLGPFHHFDTWDGVGYGAMTSRSINPDLGFMFWGPTADNYRPYIYIGSANSSTTLGVHGGRDPNLNQAIYYRSGAVTGQVAQVTVTSLNATYVDQNGDTHTNALAYTAPTQAMGGDSGAPIFVLSTTGNSLHVRGFHTANSTSGNLHFGERYSRAMIGSVLVCSSSSCLAGS